MNVLDLFDSLGIAYSDRTKHSTAGWVQLAWCPGCSLPGDTNWRLGVNTKSVYFHCWSCGGLRGGEVLSALTGRSVPECITLLGGCERGYLPPSLKKKGKLIIPDGVMEMLPVHEDYLLSRNISPDYARKVWGVKGIAHDKRLAWRLWLPVTLGRVVSWTTRAIGAREPKYLTASPDEEEVHHKELLFGEDRCGNSMLVCEGPLDVLRFGEGAVATFGTAFTPAQVKRIGRYARRVVCMDSDRPGREATRKLADELDCLPGRTLVVELDSKDIGECSGRELRALRKLLQ